VRDFFVDGNSGTRGEKTLDNIVARLYTYAMPRPKVYETDADKHAAFRKRRSEERKASQPIIAAVEQAQNALRDDIGGPEEEWWHVTVTVDLPDADNPKLLDCKMSNDELMILKEDLANYEHSAHSKKYGFYACVNFDNGTPINAALGLEGARISERKLILDYKPPPSYTTTKCAADLMRMEINHQKRRS
jgi:hypothetical protein